MALLPTKNNSAFDQKLRRISDEADLIQADIRSLEKKLAKKNPPPPASPKRSPQSAVPGQAPYRPPSREARQDPGKLGRYLVTGSFTPVVDNSLPWPVRRNRRIFFSILTVIVLFVLIWTVAGC